MNDITIFEEPMPWLVMIPFTRLAGKSRYNNIVTRIVDTIGPDSFRRDLYHESREAYCFRFRREGDAAMVKLMLS